MNDFDRDKAWADSHAHEVNRVVRYVAPRIVHVARASMVRDVREGIDYDVIVPWSAIACRIRRERPHRDLTITTHRPSGVTPEVTKIRKGGVDWYLYAWSDNNRFVDWMFVDLDTVRRAGLMDRAPEIPGKDGSKFLYIPFTTLRAADAILESTMP